MKDLTTVKQWKATTVQDRSGKCFTEEQQILNRWTEYCSELYNYKANEDPSVLNCPQKDTEDDHPILCREVEAAVQSLKKGKSAGVANIPAELVLAGGEDVITALTTICNKVWQTREWPAPWTQSLVITLPKKGNLQQCQNYGTEIYTEQNRKEWASSVGLCKKHDPQHPHHVKVSPRGPLSCNVTCYTELSDH